MDMLILSLRHLMIIQSLFEFSAEESDSVYNLILRKIYDHSNPTTIRKCFVDFILEIEAFGYKVAQDYPEDKVQKSFEAVDFQDDGDSVVQAYFVYRFVTKKLSNKTSLTFCANSITIILQKFIQGIKADFGKSKESLFSKTFLVDFKRWAQSLVQSVSNIQANFSYFTRKSQRSPKHKN